MLYIETSEGESDWTTKVPRSHADYAFEIQTLQGILGRTEQIHLSGTDRVKIVLLARVNGILERLPAVEIAPGEPFSFERYHEGDKFRYAQMIRDIVTEFGRLAEEEPNLRRRIVLSRSTKHLVRFLLSCREGSYHPPLDGTRVSSK